MLLLLAAVVVVVVVAVIVEFLSLKYSKHSVTLIRAIILLRQINQEAIS